MKGRSCSTSLISFSGKVVDERKALNVVYLEFSKALDVSHSILLENLSVYSLHGCNVLWVKTGWGARCREWW